jgi:hypothetical protein
MTRSNTLIQSIIHSVKQVALGCIPTLLSPPTNRRDILNQLEDEAPMFGESMAEVFALGFGTASTLPLPTDTAASRSDIINSEVTRYLQEEPTNLDIGEFWKGKQFSYPYLSRAARIILGCPPSAGAIEWDISGAGLIVTSRRTRLLASNIEMSHFVNRDKNLVKLNQVALLSKEEAQRAVPKNVEVADELCYSEYVPEAEDVNGAI